MKRYFAYCEKHGRLGDYHTDPDKASKDRKAHMLNDTCFGSEVSIIEEYIRYVYGHNETRYRKYR